MDDLRQGLLGLILMVVGLGLALSYGGSMGHSEEGDYLLSMIAYVGGFITAFIGVGLLLKVYQKHK